jgi:hypothetical protein
MTDTNIEPDTFGITIEPKFLGETVDDDGWKHNLWHVTLRREDDHNGRRMITTEYRMGLGLVDPPKRKSYRPRRADEFPTSRTPTLVEVLHSLQLDARVLEWDEFDDICGPDTPYRQAQALKAALHVSRDKTRTLLGLEYRQFLDVEYDT